MQESFLPDARVGWVSFGIRRTLEIIRREHIRLVFVSTPPHSAQLIGRRLMQKIGLPLVADLCDPWSEIRYYSLIKRSYWTTIIDQALERLVEYYFIMSEEKLKSGYSQKFQFDEEGIPIIPTFIDVEEQKLIYYPISIGQYGLSIWDTYLTSGSEQDRKHFLKISDWFCRTAIEHERLGAYWLTEVEKPAYRIQGHWKSAFTQARAINMLLHAYQVIGDLGRLARLAVSYPDLVR